MKHLYHDYHVFCTIPSICKSPLVDATFERSLEYILLLKERRLFFKKASCKFQCPEFTWKHQARHSSAENSSPEYLLHIVLMLRLGARRCQDLSATVMANYGTPTQLALSMFVLRHSRPVAVPSDTQMLHPKRASFMGRVISETPCWGLHWRCGFLRGTEIVQVSHSVFPVLDLESLFQAHALLLRCGLLFGKSSNFQHSLPILFFSWIKWQSLATEIKIKAFSFPRLLSFFINFAAKNVRIISLDRPTQPQGNLGSYGDVSPRSPDSCMEEVWNVSFIVCIFGSITCIFQESSELSTPSCAW